MMATESSGLRLLKTRWHALAPRERLALQTAAWVLGLGLLWWLAIGPALQTLRAAQAQHIELDQQHQLMLAQQVQAQTLQAMPKISTADALKALEASTQQGLGTTAQMNTAGDRVTITFKGLAPDALAQWLALARVNAHALPTDAHLTRSAPASNGSSTATTAPPPTNWNGSIVLRLP